MLKFPSDWLKVSHSLLFKTAAEVKLTSDEAEAPPVGHSSVLRL